MNKTIYEFIGLKEDHRAFSKITQQPNHLDLITVKKSLEGPFFVDDKEDGNSCVIVKKGKKIGFFTRNGKHFSNTEALLPLLKPKKMEDGVYFTEWYCDSEIMSMMKFQSLHGPNRTNPLTPAEEEVHNNESKLCFFDYISLEAFIGDSTGVAKDDTPMGERRKKLEKAIKKFSTTARAHHVRYVKADTIEEVKEIAAERIKQGKEGVVAKGVNHPYVCGHKNFHFIKKVKYITMDLLCTGYEEGNAGTKREGMLNKLIFSYGSKGEHKIIADLGKGYTDKDRIQMLKDIKKERKESPIGKVYEIYALEKIGLKNLRQPKVGALREDKEGNEDKPASLKVKGKDKMSDKKSKKSKKADKSVTVSMEDMIAAIVEAGLVKAKKASKLSEEEVTEMFAGLPSKDEDEEKSPKKKDKKDKSDKSDKSEEDEDKPSKKDKKDKKPKKEEKPSKKEKKSKK